MCQLKIAFDNAAGPCADGVYTLENVPEDVGTVRLAWAKNTPDGAASLEGFTPLRILEGKEIAAGYAVHKGLYIPENAEALAAYANNETKPLAVFDLPTEKRQPPRGKPLFKAAFVSDMHFGFDGPRFVPQHGLSQKYLEAENVDFLVSSGDSSQWYGTIEKDYEWKMLREWLDGFTKPFFLTVGNHDVPEKGIIESERWGMPAGFTFNTANPGNYETFLKNWIAHSEETGLYPEKIVRDERVNYYDTHICGRHLIFLAIPRYENGKETYTFGDEQLAWLDEKLFEDENSGTPVFLFAHLPANRTLGSLDHWASNQIRDDAALKAVLARHPEAVYVSGHLHYNLDGDWYTASDGKGLAASHINSGGLHDTNSLCDDGVELHPDFKTSHGVIVEEYDGYLAVRGVDFMTGNTISRALYRVTYGAKPLVGSPRIEKNADGSLTASAENAARFVWYTNGRQVPGETLAAPERGAFTALRAYDANGAFVSTVVK